MTFLWRLSIAAAVLCTLSAGQECNRMDFSANSFVCACSGAECDFPGDIAPPTDDSFFTVITSDRDELRFAVTEKDADVEPTGVNATIVRVDYAYEYQTMFGFGGAFTDATGINVVSLSEESQESFIRSYFAPEGIRYGLCRIPIAGSDFSTRPYSYDDVEGDVDLEYFALAEEDYLYKLPLIKRALEVKGEERDLLLFGSPWAPPAWMKESGMVNGSGGILPEMWGPYSNYLVKFLDAYGEEGAPIWGMTPQNEPLTGFEDWFWNTCAWSAEDSRDWIKTNLGPALEASGYGDVKLMVLDHNRDALPDYPARILEDPLANPYVDGVAVHWYADGFADPALLSATHDLFPDKFILYTEACEGWNADLDNRVSLGDWDRAQSYANNIIEDVTHYSTGWVDWNMALSMTGGPNWANNYVDAPIIIDAETDTFYKQPMFYAMGHFSKFIIPGAKAIYRAVIGDDEHIKVAAFLNPDGVCVLVLLNTAESERPVTVEPGFAGTFYNLVLPARSLQTVLYTPPPQ